MSVGALSHFGFVKEITAGTMVTPVTKFFDPTSADIDDSFPREAISTMREDRAMVRSISKITETKGNWKSPFYFNALPLWFRWAMGASTTVAAGTGWKHTFTGAQVLPSFTAEVSFYSGMAKQSAGNKVDKLTISAKAGEVAEITCDFLGLSTAKNAPATVSGLPADDNLATFSFASVTLDAVANTEIMSMELGVENNLEAIDTLNGTNFSTRIAEGPRKINCGLEMDFLTQAMYDLSRAATSKAIVLEFLSTVMAGGAGQPYKAIFTMPIVKFANVSSPIEADGIISQKIDAVPLYDTATSTDLKIEVVNSDVAYT